MKILVVGGGGREHAIVKALVGSPNADRIWVAPGNAGTARDAENIPIRANDLTALVDFAQREGIDLTVVGPEQPLVDGIVERFRDRGLQVIGPTAPAAQLEGSKAFAKAFMLRHGIPTAAFQSFGREQVGEALAFAKTLGAPVVVKVSGLAAGKGAIICESTGEARETIEEILVEGSFGEAGSVVVIEEFMRGQEASVFALCDGRDYVLLSTAQDHKRVGEGDTGPNTGGMGAYAPAVILDDATLARVEEEVVRPTIRGMAEEGMPYTGFLYVGLMLTADGPRVVEYNCRLGDPEAQVILPLLKTDLAELLDACAEQRLGGLAVEHRDGAAACVVLCSGGYPGAYRKGLEISGLDDEAPGPGVAVIHAGTDLEGERVVTSGGRVLGVTAVGDGLEAALDRAYRTAAGIHFEGMFYRRDIGRKGIEFLEAG